MVDEKDNIKVDSNETRAALEYFKKLMAFNPPEVYAWDDAGNNRWLISGKGAGIMRTVRAPSGQGFECCHADSGSYREPAKHVQ